MITSCTASSSYSALSAEDLCQQLVEGSTAAASPKINNSVLNQKKRYWKPRLAALHWGVNASLGCSPRAVLIPGDVVNIDPVELDAPTCSVSLGPLVRFRFYDTGQKQITGILSYRRSSKVSVHSLDWCRTYFADECCAQFVSSLHSSHCLLQKKIVSWVMEVFNRNHALRNVALSLIERAFPFLRLHPVEARCAFLQEAVSIFGGGTFIWYDGAVIRQFKSGTTLYFPTLTSNEERSLSTHLLALSTVHRLYGNRLAPLLEATDFLLRVYKIQHLVLSETITSALLLVSASLGLYYTQAKDHKSTIHRVLLGHLYPLSRAPLTTQENIWHAVGQRRRLEEVMSQLFDLTEASQCSWDSSAIQGSDKTNLSKDEVHSFFSENDILYIRSRDFKSQEWLGSPPQLLPSAPNSTQLTLRQQSLGLAAIPLSNGLAAAANPRPDSVAMNLTLSTKMAAQVLNSSKNDDDAFLAVVMRTRRRRAREETITPQLVQQALETAHISLKRRDYLQLVDLLALASDATARQEKASDFLRGLQVRERNILTFLNCF